MFSRFRPSIRQYIVPRAIRRQPAYRAYRRVTNPVSVSDFNVARWECFR
jgi:hypothetical protein